MSPSSVGIPPPQFQALSAPSYPHIQEGKKLEVNLEVT